MNKSMVLSSLGVVLLSSSSYGQLTFESTRTISANPFSEVIKDVNGVDHAGVGAGVSAPAAPGGTSSESTTIQYGANLVWAGSNPPTTIAFQYYIHVKRLAICSLASSSVAGTSSGSAVATSQIRTFTATAGTIYRGSTYNYADDVYTIQHVTKLEYVSPSWSYVPANNTYVATVSLGTTVTATASASYSPGRAGNIGINDDEAAASAAESYSDFIWVP